MNIEKVVADRGGQCINRMGNAITASPSVIAVVVVDEEDTIGLKWKLGDSVSVVLRGCIMPARTIIDRTFD